jgi:hypothetical protein
VREAELDKEREALDSRYSQALEDATHRGLRDNFLEIERLASGSHAVICMPLARLLPLSADSNALLATFSLQVDGESRVPSNTISDAVRTSVEQAFFPNYASSIRFGALSLNGRGQSAYGGCNVELKDVSVEARSTVFDSPLFEFVKQHNVNLAEPIPVGYRATWARKGRLVAAKVDCASDVSTKEKAAEVILPPSADTNSECFEVHIFGPLNRNSISRVSMAQQKRRPDRALQRCILENLQDAGIAVEVY